MIVLEELLKRKQEQKMFITEKEADEIFMLIPEGCERCSKYKNDLLGGLDE